MNSMSDIDSGGSLPIAVNNRVIRPSVQTSVPQQALHLTVKESEDCLFVLVMPLDYGISEG